MDSCNESKVLLKGRRIGVAQKRSLSVRIAFFEPTFILQSVGRKWLKTRYFPLSSSALADLLGIMPQRLGQLAAAGIIEKVGRGSYPTSAVAAYCTFLREGAQVDIKDGKLDLKQERAELVRIQRRLAELELARVEERTVDVESAAACITAELTLVKNRIRGLASEIAPRLVLMDKAAEIAAFVRKEIDFVLAELSDGNQVVEKTLQENRQ